MEPIIGEAGGNDVHGGDDPRAVAQTSPPRTRAVR
jgi:hypothetical protein